MLGHGLESREDGQRGLLTDPLCLITASDTGPASKGAAHTGLSGLITCHISHGLQHAFHNLWQRRAPLKPPNEIVTEWC